MPSSVIRSYRYHPASKRLEIDFVSGRRYAYLNVPARIAEALRLAGSKGEYFNAQVRDRFHFEREA